MPAARPAAASIATTSGAGWFSICLYGTRPTITPDTSTNSTVQIASEPRMPRGMSRCGFLRFLRRGRHGVEADVGEEDDAGAAQHAAPAVLAERAGVGRDERMPVRRSG